MTDERRKAPAYQHFAKDWLVDTAHLTLEEQGAYQRLLDHQWVRAKPLPRAEADRAGLLGCSVGTYQRLWSRLRRFFPGGLNPRLELIRQEQVAFWKAQSESGRRGAAKRWGDGDPIGDPMPTPMATPMAKDSSSSASASSPSKSKTKPSAPQKAPRETWLSPFSEAWTATYGGEPNYGQLAKSLKPLTEAHAPGEVLDHWTRYLVATEARFASPSRFAQTYGSWAKPERAKQPLPDMYLTLEEQAARNARARQAQGARGDVGELTDIAAGGLLP